MEDYSSMGYFDLKAECRKKGLDSRGNKLVLLERLGADGTDNTPEAPEPVIKAKAPEPAPQPTTKTITVVSPAQSEIHSYMPQKIFIAAPDKSNYAERLSDKRLQRLANQLDSIAASKGKCTFQLDYEGGAFQVEFSGRFKDHVQSTTLIDDDKSILYRAHLYFNNRLDVGRGT